MRIDAHQHFWRLERGDYGWLTPALAPIYRDFGPEDLAPLLAAGGIDGTVLVQAAPTVAETEFLLEIAARTPFVKGVVGWVNAEAPEAVAETARLAANPLLKGLRPMIQDIADPDWMLRPEVAPSFEALIAADLAFDALVHPKHLKTLSKLLFRYPQMRVVIDHAAKPRIAAGEFDGWAADMAALARETGAWCKMSGLVTEAGAAWTGTDLAPYVAHLIEVFGPERLIWGSDWPVCTLAAGYARWLEVAEGLTAPLGAEAQAAIFGGNAVRAYRL